MSSLRNLMQAISNLNPTAQVSAESIDDITWHVGDPTSKSDIEAEVIRLESEWNAQLETDRQSIPRLLNLQ